MNEVVQANLVWIPVFPLLGALVNLLLGRVFMRSFGERVGKEVVHLIAIAAVAFSCFFTFSLIGDVLWPAYLADQNATVIDRVYPWIVASNVNIGFDLVLDRLSGVMCAVITGVGLLIHVFSVGYMAKDPDYHRYFAYLNLFMAAMLVLVLADNLVLLFVGWEGVGLCSYLLIGFWFTDEAKATAGRKAFIVNRIGDFGVLVAMMLIFSVAGGLDFSSIELACAAAENSTFVTATMGGLSLATIATLLLFLGCTGKSAQIPLYVWLPDAMAGPTPVSALIHAATMVTAGVYLIVRLNFLFALAPLTMVLIAIIGAATALFAAIIGITQNDIKKVLAYSTVSQLGYMFLAAGMGAWVAAIFHLVTHAFFKACLFLGSGAVIEACHHNQDIRTMGGLEKKMPVTAVTFFISCLAIAGIPPLAGFFSKDEILLRAYTSTSLGVFAPGDAWINYFVYVLGIVAAACTAFYMFRLYYLTFGGKFRGDHHTWTHHVREYGIMSLPLVLLAVGAALGGFLGYPHALPGHQFIPHFFEGWLDPISEVSSRFVGDFRIGPRTAPDGSVAWFTNPEGEITAGAEIALMVVSVAIGVGGWLFARSLYKDGPSEKAATYAKRFGPLYSLSKNKFYVDEIYTALIVKPVRFIGGVLYQVFDQILIDGAGVAGSAGTVGLFGNLVRRWHNGNVRRYLMLMVVGVAILFGAIYLNPTISQFGDNPVHGMDVGGLRPTLGEQPVDIKVYGVGEFHVGPKRRRPPPPPPGQQEPQQQQPPPRPADARPEGEANPAAQPPGGGR